MDMKDEPYFARPKNGRTEAERVAASVRVIGKFGGGHPADGMTAHVDCGDGATMTIINPQSFEEGGPEWVMRYGNTESIRFSVASLLGSYDYLLSDSITMKDATARLRLLRKARAILRTKESDNAG